MKTALKSIVLLILVALFAQGCRDECHDTACFSPPMTFVLELVDKESNENLLANETFSASGIRVTNVNDGTPIDFEFSNEDNENLIQIIGIGWESESVNALISVADTPIVNLLVDAERKSEGCCEFTEYNEIELENAAFELNPETGVYTVFVD